MSKKKKIEFVDSNVERDEIKGFNIKGVFDGSLLNGLGILEHLPFVLFLVLLTLAYIANRYHAEKLIRELASLKEDVKNLRAEQITTASELMDLSKPSTVETYVTEKGLELKPPTVPPYKLKEKKK